MSVPETNDPPGDGVASGGDDTATVPPAVGPAAQQAGAVAVRTHADRRAWYLLAVAALVVVVDIITKTIVAATIAPGENIRILGGLVYLTQIRNGGAAFSMATGMTWLLAIVAAAVAVFIIRMAPRLHSTPWAVCLGLILGGALGNLIDRLFRAPGFLRGHVVDFISVWKPNAEFFPAFNAADSAITIGGILLVIIALTGRDFDGTRPRRSTGHRHG